MNIAIVIQYYPYQYNQFKILIDKLGIDSYYITNTIADSGNTITNCITGLGVDFSTFEKYDYIIYTGPPSRISRKIASYTKYNFTVYYSHSLIGTLYDIGISINKDNHSAGIIPRIWTTFDSYNKVLSDNPNHNNFITTKSYPLVLETLNYSSNYTPDSKSVSIVLGEKSPFETVDKLVRSFSNDNNIYNNKYIKFHPLTTKENAELFSPDYYTILDCHKYDFTDRSKYVISAASSLLVESILRSRFYNTDQKFLRFPIKRRIPIEHLPRIQDYKDYIYYDYYKIYNDLLPDDYRSKSLYEINNDIIKEQVLALELIERNYL